MITDWISTIRQIRVIVVLELIGVKDVFIVTHSKLRESIGYDVVFAFDIFRSISVYFKRIIEVRLGQQYFTSYRTFDSIKTLLVLVFPVLFDVFGS